MYLSVQQKMRLNWTTNEEHKLSDSQEEAIKASTQVLNELFEQYPATEKIYETLKQDLENHYSSTKKPNDSTWLLW